MITIDQLLESIDLDFKPRWVTKNKNGCIFIWGDIPRRDNDYWTCDGKISEYVSYNHLKLSEFDGKDWTECIYEVPKKPTDKIEKLDEHAGNMQLSSASMTRNQFVANTIMKKINELVDAVNELEGEKNE